MFDIGWGELLVIGVVALIAIGPKELPSVLRTIGQYMGKVRRMAAEFQGQFHEAMREAEMADLKKEVESLTDQAQSFATNFDPLAPTPTETPKPPDGGTGTDPAAAASTAVPATEPAATPVPDAAPAEATVTPAAAPPSIDVPMPEPAPPVTEKDFAAAPPPAPHPKPGESGT